MMFSFGSSTSAAVCRWCSCCHMQRFVVINVLHDKVPNERRKERRYLQTNDDCNERTMIASKQQRTMMATNEQTKMTTSKPKRTADEWMRTILATNKRANDDDTHRTNDRTSKWPQAPNERPNEQTTTSTEQTNEVINKDSKQRTNDDSEDKPANERTNDDCKQRTKTNNDKHWTSEWTNAEQTRMASNNKGSQLAASNERMHQPTDSVGREMCASLHRGGKLVAIRWLQTRFFPSAAQWFFQKIFICYSHFHLHITVCTVFDSIAQTSI